MGGCAGAAGPGPHLLFSRSRVRRSSPPSLSCCVRSRPFSCARCFFRSFFFFLVFLYFFRSLSRFFIVWPFLSLRVFAGLRRGCLFASAAAADPISAPLFPRVFAGDDWDGGPDNEFAFDGRR